MQYMDVLLMNAQIANLGGQPSPLDSATLGEPALASGREMLTALQGGLWRIGSDSGPLAFELFSQPASLCGPKPPNSAALRYGFSGGDYFCFAKPGEEAPFLVSAVVPERGWDELPAKERDAAALSEIIALSTLGYAAAPSMVQMMDLGTQCGATNPCY